MKRILIIEDDQVVARIYSNKLSFKGHQVEVAPDGETGLRRIQEAPPDLVILDLMLPKLSGIEVMRKVRAESATSQIPIVVFSNTYMASMVQEAWEAGATKCLSKANCTPTQLTDVIRELLNPPEPTIAPAPEVAVPTVAPTPTAAPLQNESSYQVEMCDRFADNLPHALAGLRPLHRSLISAENKVARNRVLQELGKRAHSLAASAAIAGMSSLATVAEAFEGLLLECERPEGFNASTLRTISSTIDFLGFLVEKGPDLLSRDLSNARILVVDDEAISRRAIRMALEKTKLPSLCVADPRCALQIAEENEFDLVILDINMPEMSGVELCTSILTLPGRNASPAVIFVTGLTDLETRAQSTANGGSDFIAKPFLYPELALKVLQHLIRRFA